MGHEGGQKCPHGLWMPPNCTAALKNARYILKSFQISYPYCKFAFYSFVIKGKLF